MTYKQKLIHWKERRQQMLRLKLNGMSGVEIARRYRVTSQAVYQLIEQARRENGNGTEE